MMKVKANYSISCDKGDFRTGDIFEIKACDLPMYGDAVAVVEDIPAASAAPEVQEEVQEEVAEEPVAEEPVAEESVQEEHVAEEPAVEEPKAEKPKTSSTRRKKISEAK